MDAYLENIIKLFDYYKLLAEKSMERLSDTGLNFRSNEDSNSIALIVKHMRGNMLSRWTDFLTSDGEKPWRKRDEEFREEVLSKDEIFTLWAEGWICFHKALKIISSDDLPAIIYIRNEGLTVMDALNRQLAHYSYHIGQIVFIAKQQQKGEWESLSIPK